MKMKISADKIYYNFFQENPKIINIKNPHRCYMHFKTIRENRVKHTVPDTVNKKNEREAWENENSQWEHEL